MGRFDALTKLEEPPKAQAPEPISVPVAHNTPPQQEGEKEQLKVKKPANPQTRKPANRQSGNSQPKPSPLSPTEHPEKYSTRLEPSMVRKIKIYAAEKDLKDYEVVKLALTEYFRKNP